MAAESVPSKAVNRRPDGDAILVFRSGRTGIARVMTLNRLLSSDLKPCKTRISFPLVRSVVTFRINAIYSGSVNYRLSIMAAAHSPRFLKLCDAIRKNVRECSIADVNRRIHSGDKFLLFDVREESEYAAGHLPGARSLGKGIIERDIESIVPDPATEIVLYCGGGFRSALAADNLQKMGYTNVISMDGGIRGWKDAGFDIVT